MKRSLAAVALGTTLLLAACTQFALVEPQKPVTLGNAYEIDPQIAWSKLSSGPRENWTIDGPLLDNLRFFNGLIDGDSLFEKKTTKPELRPQFRKAMTPLEIRDFIVASLKREKYQNLTTSDLRPFDFGGDDGFRFEYAYATEDGLKEKGFIVGAVHGGRLYLIDYSAPEVYYFDHYKATVERLVASIRPAGSAS